MTHIILPELGDGIKKAVVACWHVKNGQEVNVGDEIVEVVTDKASFCVEAPVKGKITSMTKLQGAEANVGEILGVIE